MERLCFGMDFKGMCEAERGNVIGQIFQLEIEVLILVGAGEDKVLSLLAHEMRKSGVPCVTLTGDKKYAPPGTIWLFPKSPTEHLSH